MYILLFSIVVNFFAFWLSVTFQAVSIRPDLSFSVLFKIIFEILTAEGLRDLILCIVFTLLGTVFGYITAISRRNRILAIEEYCKTTGKDPKTLSEKEKRTITAQYVTNKRKNKYATSKEKTISSKDLNGILDSKNLEEKLYEKTINDIEIIINLKNSIDKENLMKKLIGYKIDVLNKLSKEKKNAIINLASKELDDKNKDKARKILLKLI